MDQRISLITLGVGDVSRARAFCEALGWQLDGGGWGGVTLADNVGAPVEVDAVLAEARAAGATIARSGAARFWVGTRASSSLPTATPGGGPRSRLETVHKHGRITLQ
jgi:hypothetical protein